MNTTTTARERRARRRAGPDGGAERAAQHRLVASVRRTVHGGRAHQTHTVTRWTLGQVRVLIRAYRPRKPEYRAAVTRIAALCEVTA